MMSCTGSGSVGCRILVTSWRRITTRRWPPPLSAHVTASSSQQLRCFSTTTNNDIKQQSSLCIVDLRGSGLSLLERFCVEEFLFETKTTCTAAKQQSWLIIGTHEPTEHRHLKLTRQQKAPQYVERSIQSDEDYYNPSCAIVVVDESSSSSSSSLEDNVELNTDFIQRDGILCFNNGSSSFVGESVVLDHSSLLTTLITGLSRPTVTQNDDDEEEADETTTTTTTWNEFNMTERFWKPTFDRLEELRIQQQQQQQGDSPNSRSPLTMVLDTKSCSKGDNSGRLISLEDLGIIQQQEDDDEDSTATSSTLPLSLSFQPPNNLLLGEEFCIGKIHADNTTTTNTNSIVRSLFWWDYDEDHFSLYLKDSGPKQQRRRKIWKLRDAYPSLSQSKLMELLQETVLHQNSQQYDQVTQMNPRDLVRLMAQEKTSLQDWYDNHRSSWKIVQEF